MKRHLKACAPYVRVGFSLLLLWLAFRGVDWHTLASAHLSVGFQWLVCAVVVMLLATILAALRWAWIARAAGINLPLIRFIKLYFAGMLINQGLPTMIGGDSYRVVEAHRLAVQKKNATSTLSLGFFVVLLDRGLGFVGNNIVGAIGMILAGSVITAWATKLGVAVIVSMISGLLVFAVGLAWSRSRRLVGTVLQKIRLPDGMASLDSALGYPAVIGQLLIAVAIHFCSILALSYCLKAYGAQPPIEALMVALPALGLLTMLPISISGWGLRESTFATVLALWQVDPTITLISSVSLGLVNLISSLPGAWIMFDRGHKPADHQAAASLPND